jgi:hypothetical protein
MAIWIFSLTFFMQFNAHAAQIDPEGVVIHGSAEQELNALRRTAERAKQETADLQKAAAESESRYCAMNPLATDCRGHQSLSHPTLTCPAGEVSTGGPTTSAICISKDVAPTPGTETEDSAASDPKRAKTPQTADRDGRTGRSSAGNDAADETDDRRVSSSQDQKASDCKDLAAAANATCSNAMSQVGQLKNQMAQTASNMQNQSQASGCGTMATTSNNIANQMQGYRSSCQSAVEQCASVCDSAMSDLNSARNSGAYVRASQASSRCSQSSSSMSAMDLNINQARNTATQANQCYQQATGSSAPGMGSAASSFSDSSPNLPQSTGLVDCSNPQIANSSVVCICRTNPQASVCGASSASTADSMQGAVKGDSDPPSNVQGSADINSAFQEDSMTVPGRQRSKHGQTPQKAGGSGMTAGAGGQSGLTGSNPTKARNIRQSGFDKDVFSGAYSVGGAVGSRKGGNGYPEFQGDATAPGTRAAQTAAARPKRMVDLRKFLPSDGRMMNREIAGEKHSIGLRHTNLFTTVRSRYNRVSDSLNP